MSQSAPFASLYRKNSAKPVKRTTVVYHGRVPFVLKVSAMPSILVELGFISNPEEERYLNLKRGNHHNFV